MCKYSIQTDSISVMRWSTSRCIVVFYFILIVCSFPFSFHLFQWERCECSLHVSIHVYQSVNIFKFRTCFVLCVYISIQTHFEFVLFLYILNLKRIKLELKLNTVFMSCEVCVVFFSGIELVYCVSVSI